MTSEAQIPEEGKKDPVASLAGQIKYLGNGDRAAIRRLDLTDSPSADGVIYGMLARAGVDISRMEDDEMNAWRITAFAGAQQSGSGGASAHSPGRSMGRALQRAGYSETRLMQLASQPSRERIMRAARLLSSKGNGPYDLRDLRRLADPDPGERAEAVRRLVRDYYAAATRTSTNA